MACHSSADRKYSFRNGHTLDILGRRLKSYKNDSLSCLGGRFGVLCREVYFSCSCSGRSGKSLSERFRSLKGALVKGGVKKLVKLFGLDSHKSLVRCKKSLVNHINGDLKGGIGRSLSVSCLKEVEFSFFDGELHILHIFIMLFELVGYVHKLNVNVGHILFQGSYRLRRSYAGNNVLALGVDKIFPEDGFLAGCGVSREGNARSGCVAHVSEYHHLYVYGCSPAVGDIVHPSVCEGSGVIP